MYTTTTTSGPTTTTTTTTTSFSGPRRQQQIPDTIATRRREMDHLAASGQSQATGSDARRSPLSQVHSTSSAGAGRVTEEDHMAESGLPQNTGSDEHRKYSQPLIAPQQLTPPTPTNDPNRRLSFEGPHGLGETEEQHAEHDHFPPKEHWGLGVVSETALFYIWAVPSWLLLIAAAVCGSYFRTWKPPFIATMSAFMAFHWAAWFQTAIGMMQRASWFREEADLVERRQYLYLAVRLNRLMLPTALIALPVFIQAYVRRHNFDDLVYWLLFLLIFIWNMVFSVMNAYNNITWESDRLQYEEGEQPFRITRLAILGFPTTPGHELPPNPKGD